MRSIALVAAVCLSLIAPASAQDRETVQKLANQFAQTFNSGDFATLASMYAEDAYLLPPGAEMVQGRTAIEEFWRKGSEQFADLKLTTLDVQPLGSDAAREIGAFTVKTKGAQPQEVAGKYVIVLRRVGSDWKIATDIWNSNK